MHVNLDLCFATTEPMHFHLHDHACLFTQFNLLVTLAYPYAILE